VHNFNGALAALKAHKKIQYVGTGGVIHLNKYHNFVGNFGILQENSSGAPTQKAVIPGTTVAKDA
jgi:hypothetical protein